MKVEYSIIVYDNNVLFKSDSRAFFRRIGEYLSIITEGMKEVTVIGEEDVVEMFYPSCRFTFPAKNGRYVITITYA